MSKHTLEPWCQSGKDSVVAESDQLNNGEYILECFGPDRKANARHIVACVNACAGFEVETLESIAMTGETMLARFELMKSENEQLRQQRDEAMKERQREHVMRARLAGELESANQRSYELLAALEGLLDDMRLRAQLDGEIDSDGCVVLNCGHSVLYAAELAIAKAKGGAA